MPDGERLVLQVHGWLVRAGGRTVLVDTGAGSHKERPYARHFHQVESPHLRRLAEAGAPRFRCHLARASRPAPPVARHASPYPCPVPTPALRTPLYKG